MLLSVVVSVALAGAVEWSYAGASPDSAFWSDIVSRAGANPLAGGRAIRVVRVPEALITATVVTIQATADGASVDIRRLFDRRKAGASTQRRQLSKDRYEMLADLAKDGLWGQPATAPTGARGIHDGVLWFLEGIRGGDHWAIVRHEPSEPAVRALCSEIMSIAGDPEQGPRP